MKRNLGFDRAAAAGTEPLVSVDVVQHGAREHYAIPGMLHTNGHLRQLYTDVYTGAGSALCALRLLTPVLRSSALTSLLGRQSDLPGQLVTAFNRIGFLHETRIRRVRTTTDRALAFRAFSNALCESALRKMSSPPDAIVGYRGCRTLFDGLHGHTTRILDQIDGGIHEVEVMIKEQRNCLDWLEGKPDWLTAEEEDGEFWMELEGPQLRAEWAAADIIVCNSSWTVQCLTAVGVPNNKCRIIPVAFDHPTVEKRRAERRKTDEGRLSVGFLGTLTTRKGIQHLLPAVRKARDSCDVRVVAAGGIRIAKSKLLDYEDIADFPGRIPRSDISQFFDSIDVLALPSISDGFGIVQLEAMSRGIPVVASDQAGDVVRHRVDGFVVPAGNQQAITESLVQLATDVNFYNELSVNAEKRSRDFSPDIVGKQWGGLMSSIAERLQKPAQAACGLF